MANLTVDRNSLFSGEGHNENEQWPVKGSTKLPAGCGVCLDANGLAINAGDTSGAKTAGICLAMADNSAGADSAIMVTVRRIYDVELDTGETLTQAHLGTNVYWSDNHTVNFVGTTTNDILAGTIHKVISANKCRVVGVGV